MKSRIQEAATNFSEIRLLPVHILFGGSFVACLIALFSIPDFNPVFAARALVVGLLPAVAWGGLALELFAPNLEPRSVRAGLVLGLGYVLSILIGFAMGLAGFLKLYPYLAFVAFLGWLWLVLPKQSRWTGRYLRDIIPLQFAPWVESKSTWIVLAIALLSIAGAAPLMAHVRRVSVDQYLDYSYIDTYFDAIRVHILSQGPPQYTNPDLVGTKPPLYPDYPYFWMGMLMRWTRTDANSIYFIYAPILLILFDVIVLYAVGEQLTHSRWGGYLAAALAYLVFVPSPWDTTWQLLPNPIQGSTAYDVHMAGLRLRMLIGAGYLVFTTLVLALAAVLKNPAFRKNLTDRTRVGLLTVGSLLVVTLVRIRPYFFLSAAPPFLNFAAVLVITRRRFSYLIPFVVFAVLFLLIYAESNSAAYNFGSTSLKWNYGAFAQFIQNALPAPLPRLIAVFPTPLQPLFVILSWAIVAEVGFFYLAFITVEFMRLVRGNAINPQIDVFLFITLALSIGLAASIGRANATDPSGDSGGQFLSILPRIVLLLSIAPLFWLLTGVIKRVPALRAQYPSLAAGALLVLTFLAYRSADVTMLQSAPRAYPITIQEEQIYDWIRHMTAPNKILAADPNHKVNANGETIVTTNFLSGETERAVFLQREQGFSLNLEEIARRKNLMASIFAADSPAALKKLLAGADFDYLIVYPDQRPVLDLSCCLTKIIDGSTQLYAVEH